MIEQPEVKVFLEAIRTGQAKERILELAALALVDASRARALMRLRTHALSRVELAKQFPPLQEERAALDTRIARLSEEIQAADSDQKKRRLAAEHADANAALQILLPKHTRAKTAVDVVKAAMVAHVLVE